MFFKQKKCMIKKKMEVQIYIKMLITLINWRNWARSEPFNVDLYAENMISPKCNDHCSNNPRPAIEMEKKWN